MTLTSGRHLAAVTNEEGTVLEQVPNSTPLNELRHASRGRIDASYLLDH
ncbi:hypothetical protein ABFA25_14590 [Mycobacterium lepromatosis]|nr:hypothetical protein [Mycobacterium lepromatosis]